LLLGDDGNVYLGRGFLNYWNGASWVNVGSGFLAYSLAQIDGLIVGVGQESPNPYAAYWDGERELVGLYPLAQNKASAFRQRMKVLSHGEETFLLYLRNVDAGLINGDINAPSCTTINYNGTAPAHLTAQLTVVDFDEYRQTLRWIRNELSGEIIYFDDYFLTIGEILTIQSSEQGLSFSSNLFGDVSRFITTSSSASLTLLPSSQENGVSGNPISLFVGGFYNLVPQDDNVSPDIDILFSWRDTYLSQD
jgi:hypothetical protein